jgi:hypothetical protein
VERAAAVRGAAGAGAGWGRQTACWPAERLLTERAPILQNPFSGNGGQALAGLAGQLLGAAAGWPSGWSRAI